MFPTPLPLHSWVLTLFFFKYLFKLSHPAKSTLSIINIFSGKTQTFSAQVLCNTHQRSFSPKLAPSRIFLHALFAGFFLLARYIRSLCHWWRQERGYRLLGRRLMASYLAPEISTCFCMSGSGVGWMVDKIFMSLDALLTLVQNMMNRSCISMVLLPSVFCLW